MTHEECALMLTRAFLVWPLRSNETEGSRKALLHEYALELKHENPDDLAEVLRECRLENKWPPGLSEIVDLLRTQRLVRDARKAGGVYRLAPGQPPPLTLVPSAPPERHSLIGEQEAADQAAEFSKIVRRLAEGMKFPSKEEGVR